MIEIVYISGLLLIIIILLYLIWMNRHDNKCLENEMEQLKESREYYIKEKDNISDLLEFNELLYSNIINPKYHGIYKDCLDRYRFCRNQRISPLSEILEEEKMLKEAVDYVNEIIQEQYCNEE